VTDVTQDQQQDQQDAPASKRVSRGQRIPQATIAEVIPIMQALAGFNGPASKKMVAGSMNVSATAGKFRAKWASAGYYGFHTGAGADRFVLTERGQALVSGDAAAALEAKQHALVSTGLRAILNRFSTSPVNPAAIEAALEADLDVPAAQVKKVAALLIQCAEEAAMILDNRFQVAAIEPAIEAVGEITITTAPKQSSDGAAKSNGATKPAATPRSITPTAKPQQRTPIVQKVEAQGQSGPFGVSVEIKIDAKQHTPQEIGEIVSQVRQALTRETAPAA
jgi:hypothetical protein